MAEGDHARTAGGGSSGRGRKAGAGNVCQELPLAKSVRTEASSLRFAFLAASILCVGGGRMSIGKHG